MSEDASTVTSAELISKMIKNARGRDVKPGVNLANIAEEMAARRAENNKKNKS
jgi:hypothetical protein